MEGLPSSSVWPLVWESAASTISIRLGVLSFEGRPLLEALDGNALTVEGTHTHASAQPIAAQGCPHPS